MLIICAVIRARRVIQKAQCKIDSDRDSAQGEQAEYALSCCSSRISVHRQTPCPAIPNQSVLPTP